MRGDQRSSAAAQLLEQPQPGLGRRAAENADRAAHRGSTSVASEAMNPCPGGESRQVRPGLEGDVEPVRRATAEPKAAGLHQRLLPGPGDEEPEDTRRPDESRPGVELVGGQEDLRGGGADPVGPHLLTSTPTGTRAIAISASASVDVALKKCRSVGGQPTEGLPWGPHRTGSRRLSIHLGADQFVGARCGAAETAADRPAGRSGRHGQVRSDQDHQGQSGAADLDQDRQPGQRRQRSMPGTANARLGDRQSPPTVVNLDLREWGREGPDRAF